MSRRRFRLAVTALWGSAAALCLSGASGLVDVRAQSTVMPVSEIRTGMVGVGRTVFTGTRVEEFRAHILGVAENIIGTKRSLILAKLEGGPLANTGVIAGMSGSPVYIDGRLIGAVSYSLGSFSKEPIAGITPIEEMTAETPFPVARAAAARLQVDFPATQETLVAAFRKALAWNRPFADRADDVRLLGGSTGFGSEVGTMLRPIATPLVMSGFEGDMADMLNGAFRDQGFVPSAAGAAAGHGEMPYEGPLKPGDAVGVLFVNGDLQLGGTGTVTHIDGDRVYAFGHPMYNLGPTAFPMTRAYVYTVLPSLYSSSKLSTTGEVIGTFLQDRPTAIAGRLGPGPELIPVTLNLESDRVPTRTFQFGVVRDQLFTPMMAYSALATTLLSYERQFGTATYMVRGRALLKNHDALSFDNLFSGTGAQSPASSASAYVIAPIAELVTNDHEQVEITGIELTFKATEEPKLATLERVWIDDPRPRAGRTVPVKILLRTYRGEDVLRTVPILLPSNATGTVSVMVSDAVRLAQIEARERRAGQSRTVDQLIRALNTTRRNDTLYVRLLASDAGAVVNGETLPSLPASVLAVIEADRNSGNVGALSSVTLGQWELGTDTAVTGVRTLSFTVSPN